MWGLFGSSGFLGVDMGTTFKLAEVTEAGFKTAKVKELDKSALDDFSNKKVATIINSDQVEIRFIDLAANLSEEEIEQMIELEFTRENLVVQSEVVDFFEKKYAIAFAVERNLVEEKFSKLQEIGLKPRAIETEFHANARYVTKEKPDLAETVSLIDIGKKRTDLIIVKQGRLIFVRNFDFGGADITKRLAKRNDLSDSRAEEYKKEGVEDEDLKVVLEELRSQVYSSIDYFQSRYKEEVGRLILTGGGSHFNGLQDYLENQIGLPVEKLDEPGFSVAKGLALRAKEEQQ